ncbi:MAG TPA: type II toxin-antitoxin system HicA family toxin [Draconibacterium sp.]|nr:type II toxin-antitoxin system HicA family toxin [Draconibacterium sp.]
MKRSKLIKHLLKNGCYLLREGGRHTIYFNPKSGKITAIPRHPEIKQFIAEKICKDLDVELPMGK